MKKKGAVTDALERVKVYRHVASLLFAGVHAVSCAFFVSLVLGVLRLLFIPRVIALVVVHMLHMYSLEGFLRSNFAKTQPPYKYADYGNSLCTAPEEYPPRKKFSGYSELLGHLRDISTHVLLALPVFFLFTALIMHSSLFRARLAFSSMIFIFVLAQYVAIRNARSLQNYIQIPVLQRSIPFELREAIFLGEPSVIHFLLAIIRQFFQVAIAQLVLYSLANLSRHTTYQIAALIGLSKSGFVLQLVSLALTPLWILGRGTMGEHMRILYTVSLTSITTCQLARALRSIQSSRVRVDFSTADARSLLISMLTHKDERMRDLGFYELKEISKFAEGSQSSFLTAHVEDWREIMKICIDELAVPAKILTFEEKKSGKSKIPKSKKKLGPMAQVASQLQKRLLDVSSMFLLTQEHELVNTTLKNRFRILCAIEVLTNSLIYTTNESVKSSSLSLVLDWFVLVYDYAGRYGKRRFGNVEDVRGMLETSIYALVAAFSESIPETTVSAKSSEHLRKFLQFSA